MHLTTAVDGMKAQSFALENISGNIANSQTTGFKRIDTSFEDLIPDEVPSKQLAGSVIASAQSTNNVQGDIQIASISTFMAINGDGYFVVEKPSNFVDRQPVFDGIDEYTRRGDFQPDKDGYLVNGAGYYLMGIPVDATTGNLVGSVPQLLQFQNDFLPAQATTEVDYRANLASYPLTARHDTSVPGSELLNPDDFIANPLAVPPANAKIIGYGAHAEDGCKGRWAGTLSGLRRLDDAGIARAHHHGSITVSDGTNTDTFNVGATSTVQDLLDYVNNTGTADISAALDTSGHIQFSSPNYLDEITVGGSGAAAVGFAVGQQHLRSDQSPDPGRGGPGSDADRHSRQRYDVQYANHHIRQWRRRRGRHAGGPADCAKQSYEYDRQYRRCLRQRHHQRCQSDRHDHASAAM